MREPRRRLANLDFDSRTGTRVVHVVASLRADHGGTSRSVPQLCESLAALGCDVQLVTSATRRGEPPANLPGGAVRVRRAQAGVLGHRGGPQSFFGLLAEAMEAAAVIHDHGLWLPSNHAAATVAARAGKPRIVSPRGMLSPWSLGHRRWKKRLAWSLYQRRDLESAAVLHATSEGERDEIRSAGLRQPIALVPNGVTLPPRSIAPRPTGPPRRALFLSRLHPKKGVRELLEAWSRVRLAGWELVIAGPGSAVESREVESGVRELGIESSVTLAGEVNDSAKWPLYASAELFVLPTHSENFGLVIAEALASGVPVITTKAAPWPWLESEACGWWIDGGVEALAKALSAATTHSASDLKEMGARGRSLVARRFAWESVAAQMSAVYAWMTGDADRPEWVFGETR